MHVLLLVTSLLSLVKLTAIYCARLVSSYKGRYLYIFANAFAIGSCVLGCGHEGTKYLVQRHSHESGRFCARPYLYDLQNQRFALQRLLAIHNACSLTRLMTIWGK
jgi:hypothetical protein